MGPFLAAGFSGFLLGGSLIVAIGAQNAFVLRMGLARRHVFAICLVCALSDALLILAGVAGMGAFVTANPGLLRLIALGGAAFLFAYAVFAGRRALHPGRLNAKGEITAGLSAALGQCLAFTWLNPHVYLDTVVLVGGFAAALESASRPAFAAGAIAASFVWFFGLGYGASLLAPVFARPVAWRILDAAIALVMAGLGLSLLLRLGS
jgi:L-lysine exporter family protein LysE/ArgO